MPKKRKSSGEDEFTTSTDINTKGAEVYEKGGRVLRARETCMCPVCGVYFSPMEIQSHAQACLYFLEQAEVKKKPKKSLSSSTTNVSSPSSSPSPSPSKDNLSKSDSSISPEKKTPPRRIVTPKWKPNTVVGWNIPYAPVFRPTVAEFKKPLEYISKIRPIAEKYGICVIVPPYPAESWDQEIGDTNTFTFRTKVQNIHQLKTRWQGRNEVFVSNLASFLEKRGEPLRVLPRVDGRDLDLFKLFTGVVNRGGYQVVERANLWKSVADELKLSTVCVRNNTLRNHYHKYLYDYELYRKSKLQFRPAAPEANNNIDDDLYIAEDITGDLYNTDYMEDDDIEDEFGFYEGEEYTLSKFEKKAKNFSEKWFPTRPTPEQVEEEFWRIVETAEDSVKVDYGSDLDVTKIERSGFPRDRSSGTYLTADSTHWNLNRLPRMKGSVLSHIKETVAGVTDPMLYVGMLFSSFCWHTEDNYLYSINYMHKGTAKTWYGVPASGAEHFEQVMKEAMPDLFLKHPDLLHLLITMISPSVLSENKVPIFRAVQEPGQYVITFPKAYHAGFSHGFTCAEAVNFAPADWLPYGYESVNHYRELKRPSVFSHEQLMLTIANQELTPETAFWLASELVKVREKEQTARDILRLAGFAVQIASPSDSRDEPKQCKVCNYDCYLSAVSCSCSPQYVGCLHHYNEFCEACSPKSKILKVLVPLNELDASIEKTKQVQQKAPSGAVIDLTDEEETQSHVSLPNTSNLNNISTLPLTPLPSSPLSAKPPPPNRSPVPKTADSPKAQEAQKSPQESQKSPQETQKNTEENQEMQDKTQSPNENTQDTQKDSSSASGSPSGSPSGVDAASKKGIVINLNKQKEKPSPYENRIPPPPNISRPATTPNLNVSSFTSYAAKLSAAGPVSSHPSTHAPSYHSQGYSHSSSSSTSPSNKPYYYHGYYEGKETATSPNPTLSDQMQGIAINCPPSMSGYSKKQPVHVVDSPTKA